MPGIDNSRPTRSQTTGRVVGGQSGGVLTLLLAAFIYSKAAGITAIAAWSWWLVLTPLWISFGIAIVTVVLIVLVELGRRK